MTRWDLSGAMWRKSIRSGEQGGACIEVAATWRKSTHSADQGGDCIEVATAWRKSACSAEQGGTCVEVAGVDRGVAVRDSQDPGGPVLCFGRAEWRALINDLKS